MGRAYRVDMNSDAKDPGAVTGDASEATDDTASGGAPDEPEDDVEQDVEEDK
jgi:hypothetical protein